MASRRGFTLVEAAVAIGVVAILAGLTAPMAVKLLNQRREAATRTALRQVFEALFGSRDRRVANLRADYGFDPPAGTYRDLPFLVAPSGPWAGVPPFGPHDSLFQWGYNGPYWLGDTRNGAPVDAWGGPIELICREGRVQVRSRGPRRSENRNVDELVYPSEPAPLAAFRAHVLVTITLVGENVRGQIRLGFPGNREPRLAWDETYRITPEPNQSVTFTAPAGGMQLELNPDLGPDGRAGFRRRVIPMDLLPGETREVRVRL